MQLIIFVGIPASGKSTFYKENFFDTHVRLNLDMLNTRHRQQCLFDAGLRSKTSLVIDNTNPAKIDREPYILAAKKNKYEVVGYYFRSVIAESKARNALRLGSAKVPEAAIGAIAKKLQLPEYSEGFDALYYVTIDKAGFSVQPWEHDENE